MVKRRHSTKSIRKMTTSKKRKMTMRKYKHRGGGSIKGAFLDAIKNPIGEKKTYDNIESFFKKESSREKKTLKNKDGVIFTFWISGIRPIHFLVEKDGKEEIVGSVSD